MRFGSGCSVRCQEGKAEGGDLRRNGYPWNRSLRRPQKVADFSSQGRTSGPFVPSLQNGPAGRVSLPADRHS